MIRPENLLASILGQVSDRKVATFATLIRSTHDIARNPCRRECHWTVRITSVTTGVERTRRGTENVPILVTRGRCDPLEKRVDEREECKRKWRWSPTFGSLASFLLYS